MEDEILESAAEHFSEDDLDDETRRAIIEHLADDARSADDVAAEFGLPLGDVEAFLDWTVDQDLLVRDELPDGTALYAKESYLVRDAVAASEFPNSEPESLPARAYADADAQTDREQEKRNRFALRALGVSTLLAGLTPFIAPYLPRQLFGLATHQSPVFLLMLIALGFTAALFVYSMYLRLLLMIR